MHEKNVNFAMLFVDEKIFDVRWQIAGEIACFVNFKVLEVADEKEVKAACLLSNK